MLPLLALLVALASAGAQAATQYWDADGDLSNNDCVTGAGLGGTGAWNASATLWTTNECHSEDLPVAWVNLNDAVFWGTAGIVTLGSKRTVGNLTFKTGGYEITGSTLSLNATGGGKITNASGTTLISSILDGTNGYAKYGSGILHLNNAGNSVSNALHIHAGTLRINDYTALAANHAGQTLTIDGGTLRNDQSSSAGTFLSSNVTLYVGTNNATITANSSSGVLLYSNNILGVVPGQGVLTKAGPGEIRNYGPNGAHNTFGKLVISGGFFTAGQGSYPGYADTFGMIPAETTDDAITIKNGAELRLVGSASVTLDAKQGITIGAGGGQIAVIGGKTLTVTGSIKAGTNWLETGDGDTGTVSLRGANELGQVTNTSGILLIRNSSALGDTVFGTTIKSGSSLAVSTTVNVPEPLLLYGTGRSDSTGALHNNGNNNIWSGPITLGESGVRIDSEQATLTLSGGVSGEVDPNLLIGGAGNVTISTNQLAIGAGTLTKDGAGTLALNASNIIGSVVVSAGKLLANAAGATGLGSVTVSSGATLGGNGTVDGPVTLAAAATIGAGTSAGILTLNSGADLSLGGTNVWELATNSTDTAGADFDQIILTGGDLALGSASTLALRFIGARTVPDLTNAFWQARPPWKDHPLERHRGNPGASELSPPLTAANGHHGRDVHPTSGGRRVAVRPCAIANRGPGVCLGFRGAPPPTGDRLGDIVGRRHDQRPTLMDVRQRSEATQVALPGSTSPDGVLAGPRANTCSSDSGSPPRSRTVPPRFVRRRFYAGWITRLSAYTPGRGCIYTTSGRSTSRAASSNFLKRMVIMKVPARKNPRLPAPRLRPATHGLSGACRWYHRLDLPRPRIAVCAGRRTAPRVGGPVGARRSGHAVDGFSGLEGASRCAGGDCRVRARDQGLWCDRPSRPAAGRRALRSRYLHERGTRLDL